MADGTGAEPAARPSSRMRIRGRRNSENKQSNKPVEVPRTDNAFDDDDIEEVLNVRVKEREPGEAPGGKKAPSNRRLGQLFRDPSPAASAIKENIKQNIARPLSSLLRRPGSRGAGSKRHQSSEMNGNVNIDNDELDRIEHALNSQRKSGETGDNRSEIGDVVAFGDDTAPSRSGTPVIPVLEDSDAVMGRLNVAQAPHVAVNHVSSFQELDSELVKHAAFTTLGEIENECRVEDVPWTWDYLYTSICTDLREDWSDSEPEQDGNVPVPADIPMTMSARSQGL